MQVSGSNGGKPTAHFLSSKIGKKLIVPYLLLSFLTILIISSLIYSNYTTQLNSLKAIQEQTAERAGSEINFYVENILRGMSLTRKNILCTTCEKDQNNKEILNSLIEENPSIYSASIINERGQEMEKINRYDPQASFELMNLADQEKFQLAMQQKYYISHVYLSRYNLSAGRQDLPSFSVSFPIIDKTNKKIGVLLAEVDPSRMWDNIVTTKMGKTGYMYIVDSSGNLLAAKESNSLKKNEKLTHVVGVKNFIDRKKGTSTYVSFANEQVIGSWVAIPHLGWGVIVEVPNKEVIEALFPLFIIACFSLIVFSLSLIILGITYKQLVSPLNKLKLGILAIRAGNLDNTISITSHDEFGELANTLNEMTKTLKAFYQNLEQKVHERTQELENTQAIVQKKMLEFERINKFMLGRELKMIDLKKQVIALQQQLGIIPKDATVPAPPPGDESQKPVEPTVDK